MIRFDVWEILGEGKMNDDHEIKEEDGDEYVDVEILNASKSDLLEEKARTRKKIFVYFILNQIKSNQIGIFSMIRYNYYIYSSLIIKFFYFMAWVPMLCFLKCSFRSRVR